MVVIAESPSSKLSLQSIIAGQSSNFERVRNYPWGPNEIARGEYLLPPFPISVFPNREKSIRASDAIKSAIAKRGVAVVLDIGCGAGFWLEEQKKKYGERTIGYGFSASDYRAPEQRERLISETANLDGKETLVLRSEDGSHVYYGWDFLLRKAEVDDNNYYQGDVHDLLRGFPSNTFDIIVSHQAFKYFFDPLRVLKGVYRALRPGGFAFLESCQPVVFNQHNEKLGQKDINRILKKEGYDVFTGEYIIDSHYIRQGLSIKKGKKPHLTLPVAYREIEKSQDGYRMTYRLKESTL